MSDVPSPVVTVNNKTAPTVSHAELALFLVRRHRNQKSLLSFWYQRNTRNRNSAYATAHRPNEFRRSWIFPWQCCPLLDQSREKSVRTRAWGYTASLMTRDKQAAVSISAKIPGTGVIYVSRSAVIKKPVEVSGLVPRKRSAAGEI